MSLRTEYCGADGGAHVVDHGARADAPERADVKRGEPADHRAHDERQDEHPQQTHEHLTGERQVRLDAPVAFHLLLVPLRSARRAQACARAGARAASVKRTEYPYEYSM